MATITYNLKMYLASYTPVNFAYLYENMTVKTLTNSPAVYFHFYVTTIRLQAGCQNASSNQAYIPTAIHVVC